ncbi:hypothetical protein [Polaribacter sp. Q13]|uniref:hypothetical protein n=1 Tax=Polaribacter sp. Q13 TaxID=2806551 RepID=UPI00193B14D0|nr:hypothetical protein [Polaribacter sp. Q13]QVY67357.1 hypothetical protein JOP69_08855 [Polaribacter sp. Q13]
MVTIFCFIVFVLLCMLVIRRCSVKPKELEVDEDQAKHAVIRTCEVLEEKYNIPLDNMYIRDIEVEVEDVLVKIDTPTKNKWLNPTDSFGKFKKGTEA